MPHQIPVSELQEIARAQYQRQDYQTALKTFTEAIEASVNPTVSLLNDRAVVYERLGQYTLALLDARDAIKLGETNVISYLRAGRILQNINKHSKALEIYKRGMAKVPDKSANDNLRRRHDKLAESLSLSARPSPSGTDPFEKLPVELVEMILADLSFRQVVNCTRVSKRWKSFICGLPNLWHEPDFTGTKKQIPKSFVNLCIRRSRTQLKSVQLGNAAKPEEAVIELTKSCHRMHTLHIQNGRLLNDRWVSHLAQATRLTNLTIGTEISMGFQQVARLLALCPNLKSLTCLKVFWSAWIDPLDLNFPCLESLTLIKDVSMIFPRKFLPGLVDNLATWFPRLPNLRKLIINNFDLVPPSTQMILDLRHMKYLAHLDLRGATHAVIRFPPSLVFLAFDDGAEVSGWRQSHDLTYENGLSLPNLKVLICRTMTMATFLLAGPEHQPPPDSERPSPVVQAPSSNLDSLHIISAERDVTTELERFIYERFKYVTAMSLFGAQKVDDEWLPLCLSHFHRLQSIDVSRSDISGYGFKKIIETTPAVRAVIANQCPNLGVDAVEWARSKGIAVTYSMLYPEKCGRRVRYGN